MLSSSFRVCGHMHSWAFVRSILRIGVGHLWACHCFLAEHNFLLDSPELNTFNLCKPAVIWDTCKIYKDERASASMCMCLHVILTAVHTPTCIRKKYKLLYYSCQAANMLQHRLMSFAKDCGGVFTFCASEWIGHRGEFPVREWRGIYHTLPEALWKRD